MHNTAPFTAVQISDCHLNPDDPESVTRFELLRDRVADERPDLIIASGDISDDGYRRPGCFQYLKKSFMRWPAPVLAIPGNHDIGDKPGESDMARPQHIAQWTQVFGGDRFGIDRGRWLLLGLNTQVIGSGLPAEREQQAWLDASLDQAEQEGRHVACFLHAPAYLFEPDEVLPGESQYWGFAPYPRRELVNRLHRSHVRLVANGHLHWHHIRQRGNAKWVWCPSPHLVIDAAIFPRGGNVTGFLRHDFTPDGVEVNLIELETPPQTIHVFRPTVEIPGRAPIKVAEVLLDFTGTLAKDGRLLDGVAERLRTLAGRTRITVLTADTFGTASTALADLPLELRHIQDGRDKRHRLDELGAAHTVAVGNGANDVAMVSAAAIGIAVIGPEGGHGRLIAAADVVVNNIEDALDLLNHPKRLTATLRG